MELKDLLGLSEPISKLINTVSEGIGCLYRPKSIYKEADAEAYKIKMIASAEAEAEQSRIDIKINAEINRIDQISKINPELAERAKQRLLAREIEGQVNIEAIAEYAMTALPSEVNDKPVNKDWKRRFFNEAENICEPEMQKIWGLILAGEISEPGKFSLRTIDTLRLTTVYEAEKFNRLCQLSITTGTILLPSNSGGISLEKYGITFGDLIQLRNSGFLSEGNDLTITFKNDAFVDENTLECETPNDKFRITGANTKNIKYRTLIFTSAGKELQEITNAQIDTTYLTDLAIHLKSMGLDLMHGKISTMENGNEIMHFESVINIPKL